MIDYENSELGWVCLFRSLMDKSWYTDSDYVHLWIHILLSANRKDRFTNGIEIKRGQMMTGRKRLSQKTGIQESKIERILMHFEKNEQQIEQQKTNKYRIITIINYDQYQNVNNKMNNCAPQSNSRATAENTNNTCNKENTDNKKTHGAALEILKFFNSKTGKDYRALEHTEIIQRRLEDGFTEEDLKLVVENRVWESNEYDGFNRNPDYPGFPKKHLDPQILFGDKFEKYLHNARTWKNPKIVTYKHKPIVNHIEKEEIEQASKNFFATEFHELKRRITQ